MPNELRAVAATRYAAPLREGGSLPALVEADDDGMYVVKLRGAGQGLPALVAEVVSGEIARRLGLPVPELVVVDLPDELGRAEPDPEIQELLLASVGTNAGLDYLPGSTAFSSGAYRAAGGPDPALCADVMWFDGLVTNVDRTPRNPNLLLWHRQLFLIDHGATLTVHHHWTDPHAHARRPGPPLTEHVLAPYAESLAAADERLADRLDEAVLTEILELVPGDWLTDAGGGEASPGAMRRRYVDYLLTRLGAPRPFLPASDGGGAS